MLLRKLDLNHDFKLLNNKLMDFRFCICHATHTKKNQIYFKMYQELTKSIGQFDD
jgi:hypothetical protein